MYTFVGYIHVWNTLNLLYFFQAWILHLQVLIMITFIFMAKISDINISFQCIHMACYLLNRQPIHLYHADLLQVNCKWYVHIQRHKWYNLPWFRGTSLMLNLMNQTKKSWDYECVWLNLELHLIPLNMLQTLYPIQHFRVCSIKRKLSVIYFNSFVSLMYKPTANNYGNAKKCIIHALSGHGMLLPMVH